MMGRSLKHTFALRYLPVVLVVAVFIMTAIPAVYYSMAKRDLEGRASIYADEVAMAISQSSKEDTSYLIYDAEALIAFYQDYLSGQGLRQIAVLDPGGTMLASSNEEPLDGDGISGFAPLFYGGQSIGKIQVSLNANELHEKTYAILFASIGSGLLIGFLLFTLPVRVIRKAETKMIDQIHREAEAWAIAEAERQRSHSLEKANQRSNELLQELNQGKGEIEKKNKELESFVYTVSHDLKSPLVALHGISSMLVEEYGSKLDEQGKHWLQRMISNTTQMEKLIGDLLELSRIGRVMNEPEQVDLNDLISGILERCESQFSNRRVETSIWPMPLLFGDRIRIQQIFENLLTNAYKFLDGQHDPKVEIGTRDGSDSFTFWVQDNGIGIDQSFHDKVFGIFQQLKEIEVEGTGVGLTIVKRAVEDAGGKVWLESQKGKGATFYFTWPKGQDRNRNGGSHD